MLACLHAKGMEVAPPWPEGLPSGGSRRNNRFALRFALGHRRQAVPTSRSSERPHPVILTEWAQLYENVCPGRLRAHLACCHQSLHCTLRSVLSLLLACLLALGGMGPKGGPLPTPPRSVSARLASPLPGLGEGTCSSECAGIPNPPKTPLLNHDHRTPSNAIRVIHGLPRYNYWAEFPVAVQIPASSLQQNNRTMLPKPPVQQALSPSPRLKGRVKPPGTKGVKVG